MSTQEMLLAELKNQPEPVLREVWHYLKFLTRQREEEALAEVLPARGVKQQILASLKGSVLKYEQPFAPVNAEDWEAAVD